MNEKLVKNTAIIEKELLKNCEEESQNTFIELQGRIQEKINECEYEYTGNGILKISDLQEMKAEGYKIKLLCGDYYFNKTYFKGLIEIRWYKTKEIKFLERRI